MKYLNIFKNIFMFLSSIYGGNLNKNFDYVEYLNFLYFKNLFL